MTPYVNEEEVKIPLLEEYDGDFLAAYDDVLKTCDLEKYCF